MNKINVYCGILLLFCSIGAILLMPPKKDFFSVLGVILSAIGGLCSLVVLYQEYSKYQKNKSQGL